MLEEMAPRSRSRPTHFSRECTSAEKLELVLRLLRGEPLAEVAHEALLPARQLRAWRARFLEGGEASLASRTADPSSEPLAAAHKDLTTRVAFLEMEQRFLRRQLGLLSEKSTASTLPPTCRTSYAQGLETHEGRAFEVPEWGTHVMIRRGQGGKLRATGVRPLAALDPRADLEAGLDRLRGNGVSSVHLVSDPMWCPDAAALRASFDSCRPFKRYYLIDRQGNPGSFRKRHRNRINRAFRSCDVREVLLTDYLESWHRLYRENVIRRNLTEPFTTTYFERLAHLPGLRTFLVQRHERVVAMTLWIHHRDVLYFHDAAANASGLEVSASYAAFSSAITSADGCDYVLLGGSAGLRDGHGDGLAEFKRGFANFSVPSYLCGASLRG